MVKTAQQTVNPFLTTLHRMTCHTHKTFPNCKTKDVYTHVLRHYSRNSYSFVTLADMQCSRSPAGHAWRPGTKGTANNDRAHSFCGFLPNPFIQHLFLWSDQPGTWIEKYFSIVKRAFVLVSLAVWSTRPCWIIGRCVSTSEGPHFVTKDRHCSKSSHWKLKMSMRTRFYFGVLT